MFEKNLFHIFLMSLALAQYCLAKPTNNEITTKATPVKDLCHYQSKYNAVQPSEKDSQLAPSVQLLKITLSALMDISMTYTEKAKLISDQVLKDQEFVNLDSDVEEVKNFKQKLLQFEEDYRKCEDIKQLFDIVQLFSTVTSAFYEQEDEGKLSANGKIILKVLKKYDTQKADDEFEVEFHKFVTKFEEKYENLKEALKEENNDLMQKIVQWHEEFKTLKSYDKKIEAIANFMGLYSLESD